MTVYFGSTGYVELQRRGSGSLTTKLDPEDVNTARKRFSVDFAQYALLTGDQIEMDSVDGSNFELISGHNQPDLRKYIHVDEAGGIRLYTNFEHSLTGGITNALTLVQPSAAVNVNIRTRNTRYKMLSQVKEYEFTTSRDTIDISRLGDEFRKRYDKGLVSGQGSLTCFWEHRLVPPNVDASHEFPIYLAQLLVRIQQGAMFDGRFFIFSNTDVTQNAVWYEAECICTNVVVTVPADRVVETRIQFVTTGEVSLHSGLPPSYLLQESTDKVLQEDGFGILLEDPS